jgi:hypothetical protein
MPGPRQRHILEGEFNRETGSFVGLPGPSEAKRKAPRETDREAPSLT